MRTRTLVAVSMGLLLLGSVLMAAPRARAADIEQMVANAKTAADHEAIANYYDHEAAEAEQQAKEHQALKDTYEKMHAYRSEQNFGGEKPSLHCSLAAQADGTVAKADRALAKGHREIAARIGGAH